MTQQITLDLDVLASHTARVGSTGSSFGIPLDLASLTGVDIGAFGVLCSQLNTPVRVMSAMARETIVEAGNAVARTATALHDVSSDFGAFEEATQVALQELAKMMPSIEVPRVTPPLPGSAPITSSLTADTVDLAAPFTGLGIIEDGESLQAAIASGDWAGELIAQASLTVGGAAAIVDPIGTLASMGLSWTLEHMEPLRGWMNDLTGDAGQVAGFAQTWHNIAELVTERGEELGASMGQVADMNGATIEAYRAFQSDVVDHVRAAGAWAGAFASGLEICSAIVQGVHDFVRELLSSVVASVIIWAGELVGTGFLAAPIVVEQIALRVAILAGRAGRLIVRLLRAVDTLMRLLDRLGAVFADLTRVLKSVVKGGTPTVPPPKLLKAKPLMSAEPGSGTGAVFPDDLTTQDHIERHGSDFGAESAAEYLQQADDFMTGPAAVGTLEHVRLVDGALVRFNPNTDEFGVLHADGLLGTYFRPDPTRHGLVDNLAYFEKETRR